MSAPCCPACSRQFGDANAVRNHHNMKHKKRTPLPKTWGDDHEPSMAELFVDAEIGRAMGDPIEDWIADMLP